MNPVRSQLLSVRSWVAEEAIAFLERFADAVDWTPWEFGGKRLRASSAFVEPVVLTQREIPREDDLRGDRPSMGQGTVAGKTVSLSDEALMKQYERTRLAGKHEEKRWDQVVRVGGRLRLIVTGEPGGGKTCASRCKAAVVARESAARLRTGEVDVSEVTFPLWLLATDLAKLPGRLDLPGALLAAADAQPGFVGAMPPFLRGWLCRRVCGANSFIVIDALDEVPEPEHNERFVRRLSELGETAASVLVTCRTAPWERLKECVPWQEALHTVELKPLDPRHQRDHAEAFFAFLGRPDLTARMDDRLQRDLPLREHARTSLVLTFACGLLADGQLPDDAPVATLYRLVIDALLEGRWREAKCRPPWTADPLKRQRIRLFLGPLGWELFRASPATNLFSLERWDEAWTGAATLARVPRRGSDTVLRDLRGLGLLVDGGKDKGGNGCWSFAHRTVLEFLAAEGLYRDEEQKRWLLEAPKTMRETPFWFKPEWLPTLAFFTEIMGDATPLLEAVRLPTDIEQLPDTKDDIFCQGLELRCRLASVATHLQEKSCIELVDAWASLVEGMPYVGEQYISKLGSWLFQSPLTKPLVGKVAVSLAERFDESLVQLATMTVSAIHLIRNGQSTVGKLTLRREPHRQLELAYNSAIKVAPSPSHNLLYWSHDSWGNATNCVYGFLQLVNEYPDSFEAEELDLFSKACTQAIEWHKLLPTRLAFIGSFASKLHNLDLSILEADFDEPPRMAAVLAKFLGHEDAFRRWSREPQSTQPDFARIALMEPTSALALFTNDLRPHIRRWCAVRLGELRASKSVEPMLAVLAASDDAALKQAIIQALAEVGDRRAVKPLITQYDVEANLEVRRSILRTLLRLKAPGSLEMALEVFGSDPSDSERADVASLLKEVAEKLSSAKLLTLYENEPDENVRRRILEAITGTDDIEAVPRLIECFENETKKLKRYVVHTIAGLGDDRSLPWLRGWAEHELDDVRSAAIIALARRKDKWLKPEWLLNRLPNEDGEVKSYIVEAISLVGDRVAADSLLNFLPSEPWDHVRCHIADAIGALGTQEMAARLFEWASGEGIAKVREHIANAIGNLGDVNTITALRTWMNSEKEPHVKEAIWTALFDISRRGRIFVFS